MSSEAITQSLEAVAEKCGDPTQLVYARVFERHPDLKPLFILDRDDSAKGNMLSQVIDCFLDFDGNRHFATSMISTEMVNHGHLGIEPKVFSSFFNIVKETFEDVLGDAWTKSKSKAHDKVLPSDGTTEFVNGTNKT